MKWYYCFVHNRVEEEKGCANSERLGPYESQEQASHAFEIARASATRSGTPARTR